MKRPFLLLYINDFLGSPVVQAMDDNQFRWYLQLLMRAWQYEIPCHLPADDDSLMLYAGCKNKKQWMAKKGLVMSNFDPTEDKKHVTNSRLIEEYRKLCVISDKRADAARVKAAKHLQNSANAELCRPDAVQNAATLTPTLTLTKPNTKPLASSPVATQPTVFLLPLNDGKEYEVTEEFFQEMKRAYPAVDVFFQLNKMRAWLVSTPYKKTKLGIRKFINTWLSKEQDKGGGGYGQSKPSGFNGNGQPSRAEERAGRINGTAESALAVLGASGAVSPVLPDGDRRGEVGNGHKNLIQLPSGRGEKSD